MGEEEMGGRKWQRRKWGNRGKAGGRRAREGAGLIIDRVGGIGDPV